MASKPTRQEMDRIIVGNQVAIMRALSKILKNLVGDLHHSSDLDIRIGYLKDMWKAAYNEDVGFSTLFDVKTNK